MNFLPGSTWIRCRICKTCAGDFASMSIHLQTHSQPDKKPKTGQGLGEPLQVSLAVEINQYPTIGSSATSEEKKVQYNLRSKKPSEQEGTSDLTISQQEKIHTRRSNPPKQIRRLLRPKPICTGDRIQYLLRMRKPPPEKLKTATRPRTDSLIPGQIGQIVDNRENKRFKLSSNSKPFVCKFHNCNKRFKCKRYLENHLRTHTGERPHKCQFCDKAFAHDTNLRNHERIHTGDKPYKCKTCKKSFTQVTNLIFHERIHTGDRPYQCKTCQKAFTQITNLKFHERIHTGEKPFSCTICGMGFAQVANCNSHFKRHFTK